MIYPVKPIDLNLPSTSVTSPFYQSDYQIDGSATERGAAATTAVSVSGLQIVRSSNTKILVTAGTVNSQYPKLGGVAIDDDTPPTMTISSNSWVWVKCVGTFASTDTYVITIEKTTTSTAPADPSITTTGFTSCFLIGYVEVSGGAISNIVNDFSGGNLGVESFGSNNLWWAR